VESIIRGKIGSIVGGDSWQSRIIGMQKKKRRLGTYEDEEGV
jgi:hypothetical protein